MRDQLASTQLRIEVSRIDGAIALFTIAIVAGIAMNFLDMLPFVLAVALSGISILAGYLGILVHVVTGRGSAMLFAWLAVVVYMMGVGAARSNLYSLDFNAWAFFFQDLRYVMYFAIGIILASPRYLPFYHRLMVSVAGFAIAAGVVALFLFDFDTVKVAEGERLGLWGPSYYLWWLSDGVYAYLYPYARLVGRDKWRGYAVFAVYVVLGLLFMKRSALINLVVVVVATEMAASYLSRGRLIAAPSARQLIRILLAAPLILGSGYLLARIPYVQALSTSLSDRFGQDSGRGLEASAYLDGASVGEIITGQGIGHYSRLTFSDGNVGAFNLSVNALHLGSMNVIYKGGLIYLGFMVVIILIILSFLLRRPKVTPYLAVCLVTSFSFILGVFYEGSWSYTIIIMGWATPLAYVVQQSRSIHRSQHLLRKR